MFYSSVLAPLDQNIKTKEELADLSIVATYRQYRNG